MKEVTSLGNKITPKQSEMIQMEKPDSNNNELENEKKVEKEKWYFMFIQIVIPFLLAGFGMVAAGILLDHIQYSTLYTSYKEIIILVPALLGLKGNLEMTLASRLSTQVNIGMVRDKRTIIKSVLGNLGLTQIQSIIVGFLASVVACITLLIKEKNFEASNFLIVVCTSMLSAAVCSLILGTIVMALIILSKKLRINPDNVATPIAACLGDVVTLGILYLIGTLLHIWRESYWIHILLICIMVLLIPILGFLSHRNSFVKEALYQGWPPVISAMFISSASGILLETAAEIFHGIAAFQPVVNGVGGNLVAILASKLSTSLHDTSKLGEWAYWAPKKFFLYPFETFFSKNNKEIVTTRILISIIIPGHLIFFFTIFSIEAKFDLSFLLVLFYIIFTFAQVIILFLLCYWLVHLIWRLGRNPDNIAIPLLTATGDLLGISFLLLCFYLAYSTGNTSLKLVGGLNTTLLNLTYNSTTPYV